MLNPDRVKLARMRLGLTKVGFAEKLDVDRKTINRLESGDTEPSEPLMQKLVKVTKYEPHFFSGKSLEQPDADGVSFRSMRSVTQKSRDAAIAAAAFGYALDDWVTARFNRPTSDLPDLGLADYSAETAAMALRMEWGIGNRPINHMINLLESHGVRVFALAEQTRHLDAYSFWRDDTPYVFLNSGTSCERSRFDAAHELGHLVMHRKEGARHHSAEHEANAFASAFLMPEADVIAQVPRVSTLQSLVAQKKRWKVSVAALVYRLNKLGRMSERQYRHFSILLSQSGYRTDEPEPAEREQSQVWQKVFAHLWKQGITRAHIAREIGVPESEIHNLLHGITGRAGPSIDGIGMATIRLVDSTGAV
jgi:Zn-dependent peptidase ImmA (M78 family)/DNA-binding XRE family transcriptional regulator